MRFKTPGAVGAAAGVALFAAAALDEALLYGGFAGSTVAGATLGTPVTSTVAARLLVGLGMLLGAGLVALLFAVGGAIAFAAIAAVARSSGGAKAPEAPFGDRAAPEP